MRYRPGPTETPMPSGTQSDFENATVTPCVCGLGPVEGGGASSGRRRDLHPQQLVGKDVPEDGEEEEGDEGEDDDPPGALFLQALLVAAQDQQPHADAHHGPRQVGHEAGLGPRGGQRGGEAEPDGTTHLRTHCGGKRRDRIA
ncbi:hypothetical protein F7725_014147 [Dissostichus mawsoni]|uniref:Uncharacterized protein n=1 Tax=Dissostichus mawsoni TaxID=36200 RepID=A0A7J5YXK6_DISMA|nr:hypothetical protein F7725_014147 [Dissostichus mawsoni]